MVTAKGMTLIEIMIVMVIIGILVTVAIPNYYSSIYNTKVQGVEHNLMAFGAAEQKYNEDHGAYYASLDGATPLAGFDDSSAITSNLALNLGVVNDGFKYTCASSGTCTANNPTMAAAGRVNTVALDLNGNITCSGNSTNQCP